MAEQGIGRVGVWRSKSPGERRQVTLVEKGREEICRAFAWLTILLWLTISRYHTLHRSLKAMTPFGLITPRYVSLGRIYREV
jgi:hypothetical protein